MMFYVNLGKSKRKNKTKKELAEYDAWLQSVNSMTTNFSVKKTKMVLQESAAMKEVVISTDISTEMRVLADPNMLHTILRNLLSNALKFTRAGGNVMVSAKSDHHSWIEISIHDTGIGMTQEHVNNLFKIDVDTKRQGTQGEQSTGLGLMLCKEFVEINKGRIWVKSKVGIGSTFYFTLPCALN